MTSRLINASAHDTGLLTESVNCVVTSPPYMALRKYAGDQEIDWNELEYSPMPGLSSITISAMRCDLGAEPTIEAYIGHLVLVMREMWRVLKMDGTCWVNLGDSYAGSGGAHTLDHANPGLSKSANRDGVPHYTKDGGRGRDKSDIGLKPKDLMLIPFRFALAVQADGWFVRSDIIWHKPNPMPESVTDRPTRAHECIFLLTKQQRYYYNADAIKEPAIYADDDRKGRASADHKSAPTEQVNGIRPRSDKQRGHSRRHEGFNDRWDSMSKEEQCSGMRNKRDVWSIATRPYIGAHFATFPIEIPLTCIKAGCPPDGVVLDPFNGSGTSGRAALQCGRSYIGVDVCKEYLNDLAPERMSNIQIEMQMY